MVVLGDGAVSYERGTPVTTRSQKCHYYSENGNISFREKPGCNGDNQVVMVKFLVSPGKSQPGFSLKVPRDLPLSYGRSPVIREQRDQSRD